MSGTQSVNTTINAPNNRLTLDSNGNVIMLTGELALQQIVLQAMQTLYGEMIYNPAGGLPYFQDIWQNQRFVKWETVARTTILAIAGVIRINSLTYSLANDVFKYTAQIQTIYSKSLIVSYVFTP